MSPYKTEQTLLPKPINVANAPMILGAPHRTVNVSNQQTPQVAPSLEQVLYWNAEGGKKIKKLEKPGGKGLRHFSMKVCEKVQKKGVTSYNEVADELVAEFSDSQRCRSPTDQAYDQKNIRRRVYDALNVLMAMNIISKEKKEIKWLGLPTNSAQDCIHLEQEKQRRLERIKVKTQQVHELILQQIAYKNLVKRNLEQEKIHGSPYSNTVVQLPFIIVNTDKQTVIDCSISADKMEYLFKFDNTFEISDDIEVLKRMGMAYNLEKGECTEENFVKAKKLIPKALESYVKEIFATKKDSSKAGPSGIESIELEDEIQANSDVYCTNRICDFNDMSDSEPGDSTEGQMSRHSSLTSLSEVGSNMDQAETSESEELAKVKEDTDSIAD